MSFNVRIFGYRGIIQLPAINQKQFAADSVQVLVQPYEWQQLISCSSVAAASSAVASDQATVLRVEIPDGQSIRYEINSPARVVSASTSSPILSGINQFNWASGGWTISVIDASGLP